MNPRWLQSFLVGLFIVLLISSAMVLAQRERPKVQVGTPSCTSYTDPDSGKECKYLRCSYGTIYGSQG